MTLKPAELAIHRAGTKHFIDSDPTSIVLTPHNEVISAGSKKLIPQSPRAAQNFKVIWAGENGIVRQTPNGTRRFDFILVGEHDASVDIGDKFSDGKGVIEYVFPDKEYQVKAGGVFHGTNPSLA